MDSHSIPVRAAESVTWSMPVCGGQSSIVRRRRLSFNFDPVKWCHRSSMHASCVATTHAIHFTRPPVHQSVVDCRLLHRTELFSLDQMNSAAQHSEHCTRPKKVSTYSFIQLFWTRFWLTVESHTLFRSVVSTDGCGAARRPNWKRHENSSST